MAKKAKAKTEIIRELMLENPTLGPTALSKLAKRKGYSISPGYFSAYKSVRKAKKQPAKKSSFSTIGDDKIEALKELQVVCNKLGGVHATMKLLRVLNTI